MQPGPIVNEIYQPMVHPSEQITSFLAPVRGRGIGRILVPTDFSEYSDTALQLAIDLARAQNAKVYLLHVLGSRDSNNDLHLMQEQIARFRDVKDVEIITEMRKGRIYEQILNAAAEEKPDLIIMVRHRVGNSLLSLFRSTSAKIRKKAHTSVLVVGT